MKAKTHTGDEKRVESTAKDTTMDIEKSKQVNSSTESKANKELKQSGVSVDDIASQSAYEDDRANIGHQAANSDNNE